MPAARKPMPGSGEAESIGELSRVVFALKEDMHLGFDTIGGRLDRLEFVSPQVYAADRHTDQERHNGVVARVQKIEESTVDKNRHDALAERVDRMESNVQWVWRTVAGAIIVILVGAVLALGTAHP